MDSKEIDTYPSNKLNFFFKKKGEAREFLKSYAAPIPNREAAAKSSSGSYHHPFFFLAPSLSSSLIRALFYWKTIDRPYPMMAQLPSHNISGLFIQLSTVMYSKTL